MARPTVYIDFEYTGSEKKVMDLICCSIMIGGDIKNYWLDRDPQALTQLSYILLEYLNKDCIFVAYNAVAEARCFISLGLDPKEFDWVDLHIEDKMLTNSWDLWGYGSQLFKNGGVKFTKNDTKWDKSAEELMRLNLSKPERNLAAACWRYLNLLIDSKEKKEVTDLIITKKTFFTEGEKYRIIKYCNSDVEVLQKLATKMHDIMKKFFSGENEARAAYGPKIKESVLLRGEYAARTAIMESIGYPVHREWFKNFIAAIPDLLAETRIDIASQFNDYTPFKRKWKTKEPRVLSMDTKEIKRWIKEKSGFEKTWLKTDSGDLSLSRDAWKKYYHFRHTHPRGNYAAQILRYLSLKESLNGFMPNSKKKITESYDPTDSRIRPYMNIYGAQSARSQPSASTFIPLKAAWSRALIHPVDDTTFICAADYASQEVLIQAILSNDENLHESYISGDVYLDFAKKAGAVPINGVRADYEEIRTLFKSTFLGISYGMGERALAVKLTGDTGSEVTIEGARELISKFYTVYSTYGKYQKEIDVRYEVNKFLELPCGWVMFGDNKNVRSVRNFKIQGAGSSIMRRAVKLSQDRGLKIIFTLHDALYGEFKLRSEVVGLQVDMKQAFCDVLEHEWARDIRVDVACYGSFFKHQSFEGIETKQIYIDERSKKDFEFFSPHFIKPETKEN